MKKVFAVLLSVMLLFALCSCGSSLEDTEWSLSYVEVNGLRLDSDFLEEMGTECHISFEKEQAAYVSPAGTELYKYSLEEDTVILTDGSGSQFIAELDNGTLTVDMGEDGIQVFVKD